MHRPGAFIRRGFVLIEQTDGSRNEEKEPDALYRWIAGRRGAGLVS